MSQAANEPTPSAPAPPTRKRKLWRGLTVFTVVLLLFAGVVVWKAKNPRPEAYALIHIGRHAQHVLPVSDEDRMQDREYPSFGIGQTKLVKTRTVVNAALRDPRIAKLPVIRRQAEAVDWVQSHLKASFDPNAELLRVSFSKGDPEERTAIVNAVTKAYLEEVINKDKMNTVIRLNRLKELYEQLDESLRSKRALLRTMEDDGVLANPEFQAQQYGFQKKQLDAFQERYLAVESQIMKLELNLKLESYKQKEPAGDRASPEKNEIAFLKAQLDSLKKQWDDSAKAVVSVKHKQVDQKWLLDEIADSDAFRKQVGKVKQELEFRNQAPPRVWIFEMGAIEEHPAWPQSAIADFWEWLIGND